MSPAVARKPTEDEPVTSIVPPPPMAPTLLEQVRAAEAT
jgi:hypothetical protein